MKVDIKDAGESLDLAIKNLASIEDKLVRLDVDRSCLLSQRRSELRWIAGLRRKIAKASRISWFRRHLMF